MMGGGKREPQVSTSELPRLESAGAFVDHSTVPTGPARFGVGGGYSLNFYNRLIPITECKLSEKRDFLFSCPSLYGNGHRGTLDKYLLNECVFVQRKCCRQGSMA